MQQLKVVEPESEKDRDAQGRFREGWRGGPGRPKGASNKASGDAKIVKRLVLEHASELVDGRPRVSRLLDDLAGSNPGRYLQVLGNLLPKRVEQEDITLSPHVDLGEHDPESAVAGLARYALGPDAEAFLACRKEHGGDKPGPKVKAG